MPASTKARRYERKYVVEHLSLAQILSIVNTHPAMFVRPFPDRHINNIYLDTVAFKNYHDNVAGVKDRLKVRIRWYGDLKPVDQKATLELKVKSGLIGWKESYPLNNFTLLDGFNTEEILEVFQQASLPDDLRIDLKQLRPALVNRYKRQYFETTDHNFRITLDNNLEFFEACTYENTLLRKTMNDRHTVVELKYDPELDAEASRISQHLPFRLTRSSKYVSGLDSLRQFISSIRPLINLDKLGVRTRRHKLRLVHDTTDDTGDESMRTAA